ncbi:hypothetical protein E4P41_08050 [Geodermatophilus sp. DF01-2]|uniref:hypothetical protein n=1 Tax=Geodermatophilus sp. DF01-2 TaxID=2559610 RepID=UPI001073F6DD|nr:hypothetical protein [Geodermatophilus sp. DF01_2]TFV62189.1 hypothetical protein E4P41_08050 [Geodermatophilus sp. DF01_2]
MALPQLLLRLVDPAQAYLDRHSPTARRWGPLLERAVDELFGNGSTTLHLADRTVEARVVRFRREDSLVHTVPPGPDGGGQSLSRIRRDPGRARPDVLERVTAAAGPRYDIRR